MGVPKCPVPGCDEPLSNLGGTWQHSCLGHVFSGPSNDPNGDGVRKIYQKLLDALEFEQLYYATRDGAAKLCAELDRLRAENEALKKWQQQVMSALPVSYIPDHVPEHAVELINHFVSQTALLSQRLEDIGHE